MASDKEKMLSNANSYASYVSAAKKACRDAANSMNSPISTVSDYWKGASGAEMKAALEDVRRDLNRLGDRLSSVESKMRSRANTIYNNWPEED